MMRALMLSVLCLACLAQAESLRPGQRLTFTCPAEPLLDCSRTITPDGAVILPLLGPVGAAGKSVEKVQAAISELFQAKGRYLPVRVTLAFNPNAPVSFHGALDLSGDVPAITGRTLADVLALAHPTNTADLHAIEITDAFGKVVKVDSVAAAEMPILAGDDILVPTGAVSYQAMVLGGVQKPGSIAMKEGLTVAQAIDRAGGLSGHGDPHVITLEHEGQTSAATLESFVQKGDVVRVGLTLDRKFVAVKGAVVRQGVVEWHKGMLLSEIIQEAGGETPASLLDRIEVRRFSNGKTVKYDLIKIRNKVIPDPVIEANDTVIVPMGGQR